MPTSFDPSCTCKLLKYNQRCAGSHEGISVRILKLYTNPLISLVDVEKFHTDSVKTNTCYYCLSGKYDWPWNLKMSVSIHADT